MFYKNKFKQKKICGPSCSCHFAKIHPTNSFKKTYVSETDLVVQDLMMEMYIEYDLEDLRIEEMDNDRIKGTAGICVCSRVM